MIGCNEAVLEKYKDKLNITSYITTKYIFDCSEYWDFLQPSMGYSSVNLAMVYGIEIVMVLQIFIK
jgi:hypothetical protein